MEGEVGAIKRTLMGFLVTLLIWAALVGAYAGIELVRGNIPFAMFRWDLGGKFLTIAVLAVLALGAGIGYASDRIQKGREG